MLSDGRGYGKIELLLEALDVCGNIAHCVSAAVAIYEFPLAVDFGDLLDLGNVQSGFLNPGLVQRLIQDVSLGIFSIENLDALVAITIDCCLISAICIEEVEL